jgi:hypothetical protein
MILPYAGDTKRWIKVKREKGDKKKARVSVNITGEVLKMALELRHEREKEESDVVSVSEIVRDAMKEKYRRDIKTK